MGKRKLSRRQAWRIEKVREERAQRAARRDALAGESIAGGELGPEREGLVVAHYGTQVEVESAPGCGRRCHLRANLEGLVTGDRVVWCEGDPTGVVVAQLPRNSELSRPDPQGRLRPVAANIDLIVVVIAPFPEPHANLIDRYLVAAETLAIEPVLLLNKTDLLDRQPGLRDRMHALLALYPTLGYRLIHTAATARDHGELVEVLRNRTSVLVGQSGVGKSSLVNLLVPDAGLRTGELSGDLHKGTHTTTSARLLHLDCGGSLIDSPGIREFGLWHMDREAVAAGFREFRPFLGHCRFRDCRHESEPDCAILAAAATGAISRRRMDSYRHIAAQTEND